MSRVRNVVVVSAVGLVFVTTCLLAACNALLDTGAYFESPDVGVGDTAGFDGPGSDTLSPDASCTDEAGFFGGGCFDCPATDKTELENECTSAQCSPFNDSLRLPLDGGPLPSLPTPDGGVDAPPDTTPPPDTGTPADSGAPDAPDDTGPTLPECATLTGGKVIYAIGSTAVQLFIGKVAQTLENDAAPISIVYQAQGSCIGVDAIVNPTSNPMSGQAVYWNPDLSVDPTTDAARLPCNLPSAGVTADLGFSDVFATTCLDLPLGLDKSIADTFGPVQVMALTVPQNSTETTISASAAYLVFGFGGTQYPVPPWTDPTYIFQRSATSGTQNMIASTIDVPAAQWFGVKNAGSTNVRDALIAAGGAGLDIAKKAIGILSSDITDDLRDQLHVLAFQDYDQHCSFWPDSTPNAFDKINVRDGHYPIWGPLHMLAHVSGGVPVNDSVARVLSIITGSETLSGVDIIDLYAKRHLTPLCAMHVQRGKDGGEITPFSPAKACNCYFEEKATGVVPPPGCTICSGDKDCAAPTPNCNTFGGNGYCEP